MKPELGFHIAATNAHVRRFAAFVNVPYGIALDSCTAALMLAFRLAGVSGREVITTPMTFKPRF